MKNKFLETGKIVGTHGVRGMVRIQAWCDTPEFFCSLKKVYLDKDGKESLSIIKATPHGNVVIAQLKGVDSIEAAEKYRNKVLYMDRNDAVLEEGRYFKKLGVISDVSETGANDVWHIKDGDTEYLIPCIDEVVLSVDIENEKIVINPLKGIFPDED